MLPDTHDYPSVINGTGKSTVQPSAISKYASNTSQFIWWVRPFNSSNCIDHHCASPNIALPGVIILGPGATIVTTFTWRFSQAASRKAISSSPAMRRLDNDLRPLRAFEGEGSPSLPIRRSGLLGLLADEKRECSEDDPMDDKAQRFLRELTTTTLWSTTLLLSLHILVWKTSMRSLTKWTVPQRSATI
jgi:hypothetical protein